MRAKAGILILLGLFLLMGTASAGMADSASTIAAGSTWIVANNNDVSVITVVARNMSSGAVVPSAAVSFTVNDPAYGLFSIPLVTTDAAGVATSSFKAKTRSGTAVITATIISDDNGIPHTTVLTIPQNIDHDLPQNAVFDNPAVLPVGTVSVLNITLTDRWGNRIDNIGPNPPVTHSFFIYMPGGYGQGLLDGSNYTAIKKVTADSSGNASTQYRIATFAGPVNWIYMDAIGNMANQPETWIEGIADPMPCYISQQYPSPNSIPADGVSKFGLYYTIKDKYKNPLNNTAVNISASDGASTSYSTNTLGTVFTSFGPKDIIGHYTLTASPFANSSNTTGALCEETGTIGYCDQVLEFYNTSPVDLVVSANPQSMASLDANPSSRGTIQAKVVDIKGNSVIGETVTYTLGTPTYPGGPYNVTSQPFISATSVPTGAGGYSTITFTPGSFVDGTALDYNATATGEATVTATWTNISGVAFSRDVTFQWKNYPYLSIYIFSEPSQNVKVGDHINLTIKLVGDGAALRPKPIDVVLVTDVSGSMSSGTFPHRRIDDAKVAGKVFAASMSTQDRVGLESYGWYDASAGYTWGYSKAKDDLSLTFINSATLNTVNTTIDTYIADYNTPMRPAIFNATWMIKNDPRAAAVKAIVLMTDGAWNYGGDPQGIPSGYTTMEWATSYPDVPLTASDSVIDYAKANSIKMYTVGLGPGANGTDLPAYATQTGGKYYYVADSSKLAAVYQEIAGELRETAGGNTQLNLDFGTISVNGLLGGGSILNYMEYMPDVHSPAQPTDSTYLNKTNISPSGIMQFQAGYPVSQDDSAAWNSKTMAFNVGEVRLNETWSATFRLNLTQAGDLVMFGPNNPGSKVTFTDASTGTTTTQILPPWKISIQQNIVNVAFGNRFLSVDNLTATNDTAHSEIIRIKWNTTYDGSLSLQETVSYRDKDIANSHFVPVPGGIVMKNTCFEDTNYLTVDTSGWTGDDYEIQVVGVALDANPSSAIADWHKYGQYKPPYIKLE
jgi:von Willebrand factor type A domain